MKISTLCFTDSPIYPAGGWLAGRYTLLVGLLTFWAAVLALNTAKAQVSPFTTAQIETGTGCDWPFSSIAISPVDGKMYAIWRRGANADVTYKLVRWTGSAWTLMSTFTTETGASSSIKVANLKGGLDYVSLAIDGLGRFHITFKGSLVSTDRDGIWYGLSADGTNWSFQTLQALAAGSINESLAEGVLEVDAQNRPHVAFRYTISVAPRTYTLRYFRLTDSGWVGETAITQSGSSNGGTVSNEIGRFDLAIDKNSKAHLSFRRETNGTGRDGGLNYITNTSGSWSAPLELVSGDTGASQANTNTIETDANNKVHIVHSDYLSKLYYTTNVSGSFVTSQINGDLGGDTRQHTLSINGNGDKFVVFNDDISIPTRLNYAYQLAGTSGATWTTGTAFVPTVAGKGGNYYSGILTNERRIMLLFDNLANGNENCGASNTRNFWYATATVQAPSTPAPSFTQSPASTATCSGGSVTLTATATGATGFSWQQDDNAAFSSPVTLTSGGIFTISTSGTTSTLSITTSVSLNGQYFRAVATNSGGTASSAAALLTVNAPPVVTITGLAAAYCKDASAVTLTGSPAGGSFTIDGNAATQFDPATLSTGAHSVRYSYTNGNGCSNSTTASVTVNPLPVVAITGLASTYCKDAAAVTLAGSPAGGSFTIDGNAATQFNSANLSTGSHAVRYSYTSSVGCTNVVTQNVTVNPLPTVAITGLSAAYCKDASAVTLTGSPTGGSFTIDGNAATQFNPANLATGGHAVTYRYTDGNGCSNVATQNVTVNPLPFLSITGLATAYCQDAGTVTLTATPAGGSFTIDGNSATQFNPATLAVGNRTVGYRYTDGNGCSNTATQIVRVKVTPSTPTLLTQSGGAYPASQSAVTVDVNSGSVNLVVGGCAGTIAWSGPAGSSGNSATIAVGTSQPGTFTYQANCQVDGCTSPLATAVVTVGGRLTILHRDVDNYADNNAIQPLIVLQNQGLGTLPLSALTLRYYLTVEGAAALSNLSINYAQLGNGNVQLRYVPLSPAQTGAAGYVEYSFTAGAGSLAPGASSGPIQAYFAKSDYSGLNELDDYSYAAMRDQLAGTQRITAYYNGVLIAGVEPGSATQIRALRALTESKNGPSATQINTYLTVRNEGNVALNYSDLRARYYFTSDGPERLQVEVDEGNVSTQLVALSPAVGGANYYLEIRYNQGGQLAPGASAGRVRFRISKPDGGRFDQTNDYSYQEQPAESSANSRVVLYVGADRVWGREPGASFRLAVAEPGAQLEVTLLGNPVRDVVSVQIKGAGAEPLQLQLVNAQGRLITTRQLATPQAIEQQELSVAGQGPGVLLLQVSTPTQSRTIRVLKTE